MRRLLIPIVLAIVSACAGEATLSYSTPNASVRLVEVNPGVYAVADYNEPVFFADNYYWRYYDGRWYQSSWYTGGWVTATPPVAVVRINSPYRYVHYRPAARDRVVIRDNRGRWYRR